MLATIGSAALLGIDAVPVQVEVNTGESGVPNLILVGLPDAAVKESEDRVFSALSNSGLRMPRTGVGYSSGKGGSSGGRVEHISHHPARRTADGGIEWIYRY